MCGCVCGCVWVNGCVSIGLCEYVYVLVCVCRCVCVCVSKSVSVLSVYRCVHV